MKRLDRMRRNTVVGAERLESREVLNAHFPGVGIPFVYPLASPAPATVAPPISGVLLGTSTYAANPLSANFGTDSYIMAGHSTAGTLISTGGDHYASILPNPYRYIDGYYGGNWTLTIAGGDTIDVSYTGYGRSSTTNGPFWEVLHGSGVVTAGPDVGDTYTFDATAVGTAAGATAVKFSLI